MAVRFNGTSTSKYTATTGLPGSTLSLTCWAMISTDTNANADIFVTVSSGNRLWFGTDVDGVTMDVWGGGGSVAITGPAMTVGTWYRFGLVISGTSATLYHAPITAAALTTGSTGSYSTMGTVTSIAIGASTGGQELLNGRIAAFKLWSAALTQAEVERELAQYIPGRTANLTRWHPFVNADTADYSGNGFALTSGGGTIVTEPGPPIPWTSAAPLLSLPTVAAPTVDAGPDAAATVGVDLTRTAGEVDGGATITG